MLPFVHLASSPNPQRPGYLVSPACWERTILHKVRHSFFTGPAAGMDPWASLTCPEDLGRRSLIREKCLILRPHTRSELDPAADPQFDVDSLSSPVDDVLGNAECERDALLLLLRKDPLDNPHLPVGKS
jgi:hypothetical protein